MSESAVYRIVLVEDNPGDVLLVRKALKQAGLTVELTHYDNRDGAIAGLQDTVQAVPNLILLDLNLAGQEGLDVLKRVRQIPRLVHVPVGVLTSSDSATDQHRAKLIGTNRYLHKPPALDDFLTQVGQAIREMLETSSQAPA